MKRLLTLWLLSGCAWAGPLSWLGGTYHGTHEGAVLEECWTEAGEDMLGTTVWVEDGQVSLRELFRIQPRGDGYQLDLWLTFEDGGGKHLQLDGRLEEAEKLVFRAPGESLTFRRGTDRGLTVELQKKELAVFTMTAGPGRPGAPPPQGQYILHTYLGDHVFADELRWSSDHSGSLSVPGKFNSPLENLKPIPGGMSFEIMVPEGKEPYRVRYLMRFNADLSQATGTLVNLSSGQTMGSFVAVRR